MGQITNSYTISETFDVKWFPFDVQVFTIKLCPQQNHLFFKFYLRRNWESYMMTWFIPLQIIWLIAFLTYYQDPEGNGGRDGITITAFLAMIFYQTEIKSTLPRVEYITWIEVYLFMYTLLVGVSCIEFVICIVYYRDNGAYDKILAILSGPKDKRKQ